MAGSARIGLQPGLPGGLSPDSAADRSLGGEAGLPLGNFRGETVSASENPLSMLEDAAEELTFGAHERMTQHELGERSLDEPAGWSERVEQVERIREYLENLPDLEQNKVEEMMKRLLAHGRAASREDLGEALGGFHEDVTYQQAALELMDAALAGRDDPEAAALRDLVQARMVQNYRDGAPAIQAGLNVNGTAMMTASDAKEVQELRTFYRESVLSYESLGKSWSNLVERYGGRGEDLGTRITFLLNALGADLAARGPSIAPAELKAILDDTHQLTTLSTIRDQAKDMLGRIRRRFGHRQGHGEGGR